MDLKICRREIRTGGTLRQVIVGGGGGGPMFGIFPGIDTNYTSQGGGGGVVK